MQHFSKDALWAQIAADGRGAQADDQPDDQHRGEPPNTDHPAADPHSPAPCAEPAPGHPPDAESPVPIAPAAVVPHDTQQEDDAAITRLAALPAIAYYRERQAVAERLGIPVRVLDDMVKAARREAAAADDALFADVAPCKKPVDPAELFDELSSTIRRHVTLALEQADACALWAVSTYLTDVADTSPLLVITSAERACGKTQLKTVLGRLVHRPLHAANASASALFRVIESDRPTLLIDEADTFFRDRPDLQGLVNAGHSRGEYVLRTETNGDTFQVRKFAVFGPKAIVGIALHRHLPDATLSRAIVINLHRKLQQEPVERLRDADPATFDRLKSQMARFALDHAAQVRNARPRLPDELSDRAADNWQMMLAVAQCAGQNWPERTTAAALKLSGAGEAQTSIGNMLLADIRQVFARHAGDRITTADLIEELCSDEERPWGTFARGRRVTPQQLARLLSAYHIKSRTVRLSATRTPKGYMKADFADVFARYLGSSPDQPQRHSDAPARGREPYPVDSAASGDWPDPDGWPDL